MSGEVRHDGPNIRILLDCSHINFESQPSGIPRVVRNYLKQGYRWSEKTGIPVVPVVLHHHGVVLVKPIPFGVPDYLDDHRFGTLNRIIRVIAFVAYFLGHKFRHALRRFLHAADATTQLELDKSLFYRVDARLTRWAAGFVALARRLRPGQQLIDARPGDILFCPGYWHETNSAIYRKIADRGCDIVFLIHDILPITLPQFYPYPWNALFKARFHEMMGLASAIFCVSNATRDSVFDVVASTDIRQKVSVVHNGYEPLDHEPSSKPNSVHPRLKSAFGGEKSPFLMVSTIEPKKRQDRIVDFFEKRWKEGYRRGLVLIGVPGWMSVDIVRKIRRSEYLGDLLLWFDDLDDGDLNYAYRNCYAVIVASVAEGFGLPMIEGSMARKPVLVNRSAIAEEILQDYPLYFEQNDASLSDAVDRIEDPTIYRSQCERLKGFDWPDWEQTVSKVFDTVVTQAIQPGKSRVGICASDITDFDSSHIVR